MTGSKAKKLWPEAVLLRAVSNQMGFFFFKINGWNYTEYYTETLGVHHWRRLVIWRSQKTCYEWNGHTDIRLQNKLHHICHHLPANNIIYSLFYILNTYTQNRKTDTHTVLVIEVFRYRFGRNTVFLSASALKNILYHSFNNILKVRPHSIYLYY